MPEVTYFVKKIGLFSSVLEAQEFGTTICLALVMIFLLFYNMVEYVPSLRKLCERARDT
jgi:hypothetical protein